MKNNSELFQTLYAQTARANEKIEDAYWMNRRALRADELAEIKRLLTESLCAATELHNRAIGCEPPKEG